MATQAFYRMGLVCAIFSFVLMFVSFASPYWYKSWTRVHSPFGNIGLWHVCFSGWIMPKDPTMKSYVGCWWIHSSEFELVANEIMPAWFRIIQLFCVLTLLLDLVAMILLLVYLLDELSKKLYDKDRGRMFIVVSILMFVSSFLVFLIALIFAEMSRDDSWMPRPWMSYLSWSYGLCVLSGFISAFGGITIFILGLIFKDKQRMELDNLDSAASMRRSDPDTRAKEKEEEAFARRLDPVPLTRYAPPHEAGPYGAPPLVARKPPRQEPKVGESFV